MQSNALINAEQAQILLEERANVELTRDPNFFINQPDLLPAVIVKLSRCLDYKYWKPSPVDKTQATIEILDAISLCISQLLLSYESNMNEASKDLVELSSMASNHYHFDNILIGEAIASVIANMNPLDLLFSSLLSLGYDGSQICRMLECMGDLYLFREANGYRDDKYKTNWKGKEDALVCLEYSFDPQEKRRFSEVAQTLYK